MLSKALGSEGVFLRAPSWDPMNVEAKVACYEKQHLPCIHKDLHAMVVVILQAPSLSEWGSKHGLSCGMQRFQISGLWLGPCSRGLNNHECHGPKNYLYPGPHSEYSSSIRYLKYTSNNDVGNRLRPLSLSLSMYTYMYICMYMYYLFM